MALTQLKIGLRTSFFTSSQPTVPLKIFSDSWIVGGGDLFVFLYTKEN